MTLKKPWYEKSKKYQQMRKSYEGAGDIQYWARSMPAWLGITVDEAKDVLKVPVRETKRILRSFGAVISKTEYFIVREPRSVISFKLTVKKGGGDA